MHLTLDRSRVSSIFAALMAALVLPACTVEAGDEAAHALADKFASGAMHAGGPKDEAAASTATDTQPMVAQVAEPATVAPHLISTVQPTAKTTAKSAPATDGKRTDTKRVAQDKAETDKRAKAQREADEQEMLVRARAEADERRAEQQRQREAKAEAEAQAAAEREHTARLEAEQQRAAAEARRVAEEESAQRKAAEIQRAAEAAAAEDARKAAEAKRIAEQEAERKAAEAKRLAEAAAAEEARNAAEAKRLAEEEALRKAAESKRLAEIAAAEAERLAEQRARLEAERRAEEARRVAEAEDARRVVEERRRMVERQMAEEESRRAAHARALAEYAAAEQARKAAEARKADEQRQLADALRRETEERAVQERMARQESQRDQETQRLSDRLRQIREARSEPVAVMAPPQGLGGPRPDDLRMADPAPSQITSTRVTILLVMEPGNRGIRRFNKTADPILCLANECYVSRGASAPAESIPRGRAFGPGVALGSRAGSCSRSLTCVFRGVDLQSRSAEVQPIDLRVLRHDRRQPLVVEADASCRVSNGRLSCRNIVSAGDYEMWVVPEAIAERAGGVALESAVMSGLMTDRSAALSD